MPDLGLLKYVRLNRAAAGTTVIEAAPGAGFRHVVVGFGLTSDVLTAQPQFESDTTIIAGPFTTVNFCGVQGSKEAPLFKCLDNQALELVTVGAGNTTGYIVYYTQAS